MPLKGYFSIFGQCLLETHLFLLGSSVINFGTERSEPSGRYNYSTEQSNWVSLWCVHNIKQNWNLSVVCAIKSSVTRLETIIVKMHNTPTPTKKTSLILDDASDDAGEQRKHLKTYPQFLSSFKIIHHQMRFRPGWTGVREGQKTLGWLGTRNVQGCRLQRGMCTS